MTPNGMRIALGLGLSLATTAAVTAQPSSVQLTGTVRDFKASSEPGGHPDFETLQAFQEGAGPKIYCIGLVAPTLSPEGLPLLNGRWHSMKSGVTEKLLGVDFVYPNIGYSVGTSGRLLKSRDGGATWSAMTSPTVVELRAVDFVSELRGFIACADGRCLETANGGATWATPMVSPIGGLWDIQFPVDDQVGYAIADGGRVFRRSGVPGAWVSRASVPGKELRAVHFPVDNNRGCAVGLSGAIVTTTNGFAGNVSGFTIITGAANPAGTTDLRDVHFLNNNLGFTVGNNGLIMKTTNGGSTWSIRPSGVTANLRGVRVVSATTVFVIGDAGTALVSRDAGTTWTDAVCDATANLNSVCFPVGTVGYAVGDGGAIERFGAGHLITAPWVDALSRPICPLLFSPALGDLPGTYGNPYFERINSEAGFGQWWTDTPGVNLSKTLTLDFLRQADGTYLFDSALQQPYISRGGFFPIDGELLGDYAATGHNFHFTFHLKATFNYDASASQMLEFMGDDDVWVFFDGKLAIDVGGRHSPKQQYVDLARLGLVNGQQYTMDFFSAERQTFGSNIRISTNIQFVGIAPPTISASFD